VLPAEAVRAMAEVGNVPLAVALLAAAARGDRSWADVAAELDRSAEVFGAHPYADTFRGLQVGASALPPDLHAALLGLAVFPPDTAVPVPAIARYWAHTRGRSADGTARDLARLEQANLLHPVGDAIAFHDLAHEYLLLHADALPSLHGRLLDAFRGLLAEPDEWWMLPIDELYIWEHLAAHLAGAGDRRELVVTATDPAYQARRVARDGPHAGETDLATAARVAPDDATIQWWQRWLPRHAHLLTGPGMRVAGTMLAWMGADAARPAVIDPRRLVSLLPRQYLAARGGVRSESSALIRVLTGHVDGMNAVAWSPDGTHVATGGWDGAVHIHIATTDSTGLVIIWNRNLHEVTSLQLQPSECSLGAAHSSPSASPPAPPSSSSRPDYSRARRPSAAAAAVSATRFSRVAGRFAVTIQTSRARRALGGKASHCSRAPGCAASAAPRSGGTTRSSTSSSSAHDPSACAARITRRPASVISPAASSAAMRRLLVRAQPLPRRRGEKYCRVRSASTVPLVLSIQPNASASHTASS
jgi:hypothetical protein